MSLHKNSDNTHEIYGRNNTRSFDTDSSKDGFERKETYLHDIYGRTTKLDIDVLSNENPLDGYNRYIYDQYNNMLSLEKFSNEQKTEKQVRSYDAYGRLSSLEFYTTQTETPSEVITYISRDANGRELKTQWDRGVIGKWDGTDYVREYTWDNSTGLRISTKQTTYKAGGDVTTVTVSTYDDFNREILSHQDLNENGKIDGIERNVRNFFVGNTYLVEKTEVYSGSTLETSHHFFTNETQDIIGRVIDNKVYSTVDIFYQPLSTRPVNSVDDYTSQKWLDWFAQFSKKIGKIHLSNNAANTDITLDNDVVSRLTKDTTLLINGDATDSVHLKDYAEFTYVGKHTVDKNQYDKLTTQVDGKEYTLLVDTDIHLFDADKGTEIL